MPPAPGLSLKNLWTGKWVRLLVITPPKPEQTFVSRPPTRTLVRGSPNICPNKCLQNIRLHSARTGSRTLIRTNMCFGNACSIRKRRTSVRFQYLEKLARFACYRRRRRKIIDFSPPAPSKKGYSTKVLFLFFLLHFVVRSSIV